MSRTRKSKQKRCDKHKTPDCVFCRRAIKQRLVDGERAKEAP